MKIIVCLLLSIFFFTINCSAQDSVNHELLINKLPTEGFVLDKGWKFHAKDIPAYALPEYDDSMWEPISPDLDIYDLPQIRSTPIGWLRIRFRVDSTLLNKPLTFQIRQHLASEIYLNGVLVKSYGVLSANSQMVKAYHPQYEPFGVQFTKPEQVVAVRFAFQPDLPYIGFVPPFNGFVLRISNIESASAYVKYQMRFDKFNYIEAALFLLLFLIHLSFYIVYPKQKANLFFALSTFIAGIGNILYVAIKHMHDVAFITKAAVANWIL